MEQILNIKNGCVVKTKNIEFEGNCWKFSNNDPQVFIKFQRPILGLRVIYKIDQADFTESITTIYYKTANEEYSEEKVCKLPFITEQKVEREIWFEFSGEVTEIRYDPVEVQGKCYVDSISFMPAIPGEIRRVFDDLDIDFVKGVLLFTHEMSLTGAPILAFHISKFLKDADYNVMVFSKQEDCGFLEDKFKESGIPVINTALLDTMEYACIQISPDFQQRVVSAKEHLELLLKNLRKKGVSTALTNTVVTGEYTEVLKDYGYRIVSLIHEMKTTIEYYGFKFMGEKIARYSDYIVFPNEYVKSDFQQLYSDINGECLVKPQGVYMKDGLRERENVLDEYGIEDEDFVIMSSGTCELRKGVDLFVDAAIILVTQNPDRKIKFVWTGDFGNKELECWLMSQLERSSLTEIIQFIPFIKEQEEYKKILRRANLFWALSREDPFPSTVLEAMKNKVPVLGFMRSGGIQEMLSNDRGILVDCFNLNEVVSATEYMMSDSDIREMVDKAKKYVDQLTFDSYIQFLIEVFHKDIQVFPDVDLSVMEKEKSFTEQNQPKPIEVREKKIGRIKIINRIKNIFTGSN